VSKIRFASAFPAVALGALLAACGGGGGGGGVDPADISTPQNAAQVLVPVLTVATSGAGASARASGARVAAVGLKSWNPDGVRAKSLSPRVEEPCSTSGTFEQVSFDHKDVSSPFAEVDDFNGATGIWRDCKEVEGGYTYFADGRSEYGYANESEAIQYDRDTDYVYKQDYVSGGYQEHYRYTSDGTVHTFYGELTEERIDINFGWSYSYSGEGEHSESVSAFFGTSDEDFILNSSDTSLYLDGVFGTEGSGFADCEMGKARILTPNPLTYDSGSGNWLGLIQLNAGGRDAEIELLIDGSADVTIDGETTNVSSAEIQALAADCPNLND
jgi:hypothetical protein